VAEASRGPFHYSTGEAAALVAECLAAQGRFSAAAHFFERTSSVLHALLGANHAQVKAANRGLEACLCELQKEGASLKDSKHAQESQNKEILAVAMASMSCDDERWKGGQQSQQLKQQQEQTRQQLKQKQQREAVAALEDDENDSAVDGGGSGKGGGARDGSRYSDDHDDEDNKEEDNLLPPPPPPLRPVVRQQEEEEEEEAGCGEAARPRERGRGERVVGPVVDEDEDEDEFYELKKWLFDSPPSGPPVVPSSPNTHRHQRKALS